MKLNPEGVEKAEAAMALANPYSDTYAKDRVTAALTAYFDHLRQAGLMREARHAVMPKGDWIACEAYTNDEGFDTFPALIICTEEE